MKYIYVLEYTLGHIYEITMTNEEYEKQIETIGLRFYLYQYYHLKEDNIHWLVSDRKLEVEHLEKPDKPWPIFMK